MLGTWVTHLAHLPLRQQQSSLIRPCHMQSAARTQHPGASLVYRAVSDDTLGSFWSLFPGSSVLQCHGVFPSGTYIFAAASGRSSQSSQQQSSQQSRSRYRASLVYRAISDDTLGSFWSLFPGSSVLQCHGVFPSGTYVFAAASGRSSQQQSSQQSRSR